MLPPINLKIKLNLDKIALIYNYYLHADTGLGWESFKKNNLLKKEGIHTSAFVVDDLVKRFPIYEGLPTVERHRGMNPYIAAIELLHEAKVDNVFIGDSEATVETLKYINEYLQNHIITILCNLLSEYKHLYNKEINIRPDQPENIIRLLLTRKPNVGIRHNIARHRGSIVMQNRLAARYSGEVYLVKHDLPFEARSNVIGFVSPEYVNLFDQIDADIRIKLIPIN